MRKGTYVGSDYNGNKYYEDRDAPYGRTRWVEYPTMKGWFEIDNKFDGSMVRVLFALPSPCPHLHRSRDLLAVLIVLCTIALPARLVHALQVSPEWHGWLHYMHDKTGPEMVRAPTAPRCGFFPPRCCPPPSIQRLHPRKPPLPLLHRSPSLRSPSSRRTRSIRRSCVPSSRVRGWTSLSRPRSTSRPALTGPVSSAAASEPSIRRGALPLTRSAISRTTRRRSTSHELPCSRRRSAMGWHTPHWAAHEWIGDGAQPSVLFSSGGFALSADVNRQR